MTVLARYEGRATDEFGNAVPGASIEVRSEIAGQPLAAIYEDRAGATPLSNPFSADSDGKFAFHVSGGPYQVKATSGAFDDTQRYVGIGTAAEHDIDAVKAGLLLTWDNGTSDADPGAGKMRANNASLGSATMLYISKDSRAGSDITQFLLHLDDSPSTIKGQIVLTNSADEKQAFFELTAITDATGYVKLTATYVGGETSFSSDAIMSFQFSRTGDLGDMVGANNLSELTDFPLALSNIFAAPLPVAGQFNMVVNGDHVVSQINADTAITGITNASTYITDQWLVRNSGAVVVTGQRSQTSPPDGFPNFLRTTITTVDSSIGAGDFLVIETRLEGYRFAPTAFGTATAQQTTYGFLVRSSITGTFGFAVRNGAGNRTYVSTFTVNSANTWELKTFTIAGDTSGTWPKDATFGASLFITLSAGSDLQTTAGSWQASGALSTSAQTNFSGTNGATFDLTGFVALATGNLAAVNQTTLAAQLHKFMRPYSEELRIAERYFLRLTSDNLETIGAGGWVSTTVATVALRFRVPMRIAPTLTVGTVGNFSILQGANFVATTAIAENQVTISSTHLNATVASGSTIGQAALLRGASSGGTLSFDARMG